MCGAHRGVRVKIKRKIVFAALLTILPFDHSISFRFENISPDHVKQVKDVLTAGNTFWDAGWNADYRLQTLRRTDAGVNAVIHRTKATLMHF